MPLNSSTRDSKKKRKKRRRRKEKKRWRGKLTEKRKKRKIEGNIRGNAHPLYIQRESLPQPEKKKKKKMKKKGRQPARIYYFLAYSICEKPPSCAPRGKGEGEGEEARESAPSSPSFGWIGNIGQPKN